MNPLVPLVIGLGAAIALYAKDQKKPAEDKKALTTEKPTASVSDEAKAVPPVADPEVAATMNGIGGDDDETQTPL